MIFTCLAKVIWSNGAGTYPIIDKNGKYGLTQFSYGIRDNPNNLEKIKRAMESPTFIKLMGYLMGQQHKYNRKITMNKYSVKKERAY